MIVVTGGAGFIGSNLVAALEDRGRHDIVVCDWLGSDGKWQNIAKRELADFVFPEELFDWLDAHEDEVEAIFHMGAVSATTETDADLIMRSNFQLSLGLWDWCSANGVRLIYASSAATYGDGAREFSDDSAIDHLASLQPLNAYGWSKHLFDRRVRRLVAGNGPRPPYWAGLKFFNVYGPNEYHKGSMKSVICHLYPALDRGEPARLFRSYHPDYADGGQLRDFVYVMDCVAVMLWLFDNPEAEEPGLGGALLNIGTGQARSFLDLARATFAAMGKPEEIEYIDMPESLRPRYQYYTQADLTKLRRLGYDRPFTSLEDGGADYGGRFLATADPYR